MELNTAEKFFEEIKAEISQFDENTDLQIQEVQ